MRTAAKQDRARRSLAALIVGAHRYGALALFCAILVILALPVAGAYPAAAQSHGCHRIADGKQQRACWRRELMKTKPCVRHLLSAESSEAGNRRTTDYVACLKRQDAARMALLDWMQDNGRAWGGSRPRLDFATPMERRLLFAAILTKCQLAVGKSRDYEKLHDCLVAEETVERRQLERNVIRPRP